MTCCVHFISQDQGWCSSVWPVCSQRRIHPRILKQTCQERLDRSSKPDIFGKMEQKEKESTFWVKGFSGQDTEAWFWFVEGLTSNVKIKLVKMWLFCFLYRISDRETLKRICNPQYDAPRWIRRPTAARDTKQNGQGHTEMAISQELMAAFTFNSRPKRS